MQPGCGRRSGSSRRTRYARPGPRSSPAPDSQRQAKGETEQNAPIGRAVIGGLLFATVGTLFIVPVIYSMIRKQAPINYDQRIEEETRGHLLASEQKSKQETNPKKSDQGGAAQ